MLYDGAFRPNVKANFIPTTNTEQPCIYHITNQSNQTKCFLSYSLKLKDFKLVQMCVCATQKVHLWLSIDFLSSSDIRSVYFVIDQKKTVIMTEILSVFRPTLRFIDQSASLDK